MDAMASFICQNCRHNHITTAQQGAAPDRLQLRSLRSCLAPVSALPAAGELGRCAAARGLAGCVILFVKEQTWRWTWKRSQQLHLLCLSRQALLAPSYNPVIFGILQQLSKCHNATPVLGNLRWYATEMLYNKLLCSRARRWWKPSAEICSLTGII